MKDLIKIAFSNSKYVSLLLFSLITSLLFTLAQPLEIFSLGVITKKGPDFFELFSPVKDNTLQPGSQVSREEMENRFKELDKDQKGYVTKEEAAAFAAQYSKTGVVDRGLQLIKKIFPVDKSIGTLVAALLFVALYKAITLFCYRYGSRLFSIQVSKDLRQYYFEHLQKLPISFYQEHNIGSLSSRVVNDASTIADAINALLVNYIQTPFAFLSTLILCFAVSIKLSLIIFFGLPLLFFPIMFLAKAIRKISRQMQKRQETFASVLIEFLSGVQTVKIFAREEFSLKKYTEQNEQMAALERKSSRYDLSARPVLHTIGIICLITVLLIGLYGLKLPIHEMVLFCGMLSCAYEPIKKFADENSRIQRGITATERMFEVLRLDPKIQDHEDACDFFDLKDSIEFNNVTFGYVHEPVLQDVSFTVRRGKKVAIVGPTGAGKSTIALLIPRLWDIQKGEILVDGKPLSSYTQRSLREKIGFVSQKPFLFFDTVAENIAFGRNFSKDEIFEAATLAHADEFIRLLPHGYNTLLAEAGKSLSGGQQQRIAIARALVKRAPILIMDEATSSLDAISEEHIKQALKGLKGKITQIIIAHRLSTIEDADSIIYLDKGKKVAEGTKDELMVSCPPFKRMWELMHTHHHYHQ
jgi:ABC-type multidrug transport system fused ATPase/permease subunit